MGSRGRASERIAKAYLESVGYKVLKCREKIVVEGVEVGEADLIVEDESGERFLVEVKSGKLDVNGLRQVYTNSKLLNLKPMVVCRGFSDDSARTLASHLKVRVIELNELFLVDPTELESIVRCSIEELTFKTLKHTLKLIGSTIDFKVLEALSQSSNLVEFSKKLGINVREAGELLKEIYGEKPRAKDYNVYRTSALLTLLLHQLVERQ